jgi:hypothetical protein
MRWGYRIVSLNDDGKSLRSADDRGGGCLGQAELSELTVAGCFERRYADE